MLLKLKIAVPKQQVLVNQAWSTIAAFIRAHRQRARDQRILARLNGHSLRDIGLNRASPFDRTR